MMPRAVLSLTMFRLWSPNILDDEAVADLAFVRWTQHPADSPSENWRQAVATEVVNRIRPHLVPLTPELNDALVNLTRQACLEGANWSDFYSGTLNFVKAHATDASKMTDYFKNLTSLWTPLLKHGRFVDGETLWRAVLTGVRLAEQHLGVDAHKGAGFFYWGLNEVLAGNLQHGFLLMHEALSEDRRTYGYPPPTPSAAFATLNASHADLPDEARLWILDHVGPVKQAIKTVASRSWTSSPGMPVPPSSLPAFHTRLLAHANTPDRVYMFVYSLAMLSQALQDRAQVRGPAFGSQVILDALLNPPPARHERMGAAPARACRPSHRAALGCIARARV